MNAWKNHLAVKRIFNVFKRNKDKVYAEDIEALKIINALVDNGAGQVATDNILFTKLLCAMLRYHLWHYSDIQLAKQKISSDLQLSMGAQVSMLAKTLNDIDVSAFMDTVDRNNLKNHEKELIEKLNQNWKEDNVRKSLYRTANDLITNIAHYK